jgi:hypothetical protein
MALIPPCNYSFPVTSTDELFELAHVVTSVGIGASIALIERLAFIESLFTGLLSSVLTVESRHDALKGDVPNPTPFDTGISDVWAYNLALPYVIPGSCPVEIPSPILPRLTVAQATGTPEINITQNSRKLEFTWNPTEAPFVDETDKQLLIGWVHQLNSPIYTPVNITDTGKGTSWVPQDIDGVASAAIIVQQPDNICDLALTIMAGPVLIAVS